ncbi:MAG: phage Gp37/Gp68 family protein [Dermatophilus congolensis]|nr:phage Gp37/Gp68 family protein [Dermatophilus congolensis]
MSTAIEWTDATWNPVTGCDRVAAGCDHCYALAMANRLKAMGSPKYQVDGNEATSGPGFGVTIHRSALGVPRSWRRPRMVFVNSMSDLFHPKVPIGFVRDVFDVMRDTPQHTYQILTKRALRMSRIAERLDWPPNVWMGTSVEDERSVHRIDELRKIPAAVRFLSCEPLLESLPVLDLDEIDWVIVGGESGPRARAMEEAWVIEIRDQAVASGVAFFFKQWGGVTPRRGGRELQGRTWDEFPAPVGLRHVSTEQSSAG